MSVSTLTVEPFAALAAGIPVSLDDVRAPQYGHVLEDFVPGTVFVHPRGVTVDAALMHAYATTFMEANPLYLNEVYAKAFGYGGLPAAPHLVMNLALSLGVQNDSEKAIANLGYYDVRFLRAVYAGDTLTGRTRVVARRDRGVGKPGIATVQTLAVNQRDEVVIQYVRKIMVPRGGDGPISADSRVSSDLVFPFEVRPTLHIPKAPEPPGANVAGLTGGATFFEDFAPGQVIVHRNGRTITDEHVPWTYQVMNTHPLHYDRLYSTSRSGPMSGEPIVYGGLVFAWLLGLASRDATESAIWDLGYHDGYHTQPTYAGDTVAAITRILACEERPELDAGVVRMQLIGVKNVRAEAALKTYGAELFEIESGKRKQGKEKIAAKIFEIERASLIRKRG